jgi:hypothetical protein
VSATPSYSTPVTAPTAQQPVTISGQS